MADVEFEPLTGSSTALHDAANGFSAGATALEDARGRLAQVAELLAGGSGPAVDGARERVAAASSRTVTAASVLSDAARTLRDHADRLALEQAGAQAAITRRAEAVAERDRWVAASLCTPSLIPSVASSDPFAADLARQRWTDADDAVRRAEQDWRAHRDGKARETLAAAALLTPLSDTVAVRAWVGSGVDGASFHASWDDGTRAAALVGTLTSRTWTDAERADRIGELRALLADHADDQVFWTALFGPTSPDETSTLLSELALAHDTETADLVVTGFGLWTSALDPTAQVDLGRALVDQGATPGGPLPWGGFVAVLLSAPGVPARVHRGAAEGLDALATARGRAPGVSGGPGSPYSAGDAAALVDDVRDADLDVAVLRGLARSGPESLAFFAPPGDDDLARARVARWFGDPTPGLWSDDGEALADAVRAGVLSGEASDDVATQTRAAATVARLTAVLPDGYLASGVSDTAALRLVDVYAPYVGAFDDAAYGAGATSTGLPRGAWCDGTETGVGLELVVEDGRLVASARVMPVMDVVALRDVVAVTGAAGGPVVSAWTRLASDHQQTHLDALLAPGAPAPPDPAAARAVADDVLRVSGAVHGGLEHGGLADAAHHDQVRDEIVADAGFVLTVALAEAPAVWGVAASGVPWLAGVVSPDQLPAALDAAVAGGVSTQEIVATSTAVRVAAHAVDSGMDPAEAREAYGDLLPGSQGATEAMGVTHGIFSGVDRDEPRCEPAPARAGADGSGASGARDVTD
ncbi:hypothetical protein IF650_02375 [Cellulosimicrobium terreum]|nr:hypothetical protein [Cellulosimicrobium terreum]